VNSLLSFRIDILIYALDKFGEQIAYSCPFSFPLGPPPLPEKKYGLLKIVSCKGKRQMVINVLVLFLLSAITFLRKWPYFSVPKITG
jgi:hypothetical protein